MFFRHFWMVPPRSAASSASPSGWAPPQSASGAGAGWSTRARPGSARFRARRPAPGINVAWPLDELLHVKVAVAECPRGLAGSLLEKPRQLVACGRSACRARRLRPPPSELPDSPRSSPTPAHRLRSRHSVRPRQNRHPAFFMVCRAVDFSPISRITSGGGPMNFTFDARHTSAKFAFSLSSP